MTTPSTTGQQDASLARDLIYAARYYLGRPRVLVTLATIAVVTGIAFNWTWLVAVGLAPILLSTLPCLIMCAFGVCMMCRSEREHSAPVRDVAQAPPPPAARTVVALDGPAPDVDASSAPPAGEVTAPALLGTAKMVEPAAGTASCCRGVVRDAEPSQTNDLEQPEERKVPNA
jgi:hypothetical protein